MTSPHLSLPPLPRRQLLPPRHARALAFAATLTLALALAQVSVSLLPAVAADLPPPFPPDPLQNLERTCFQTGQAWSPAGNLRSDVAIVYGIDPQLPDRIDTWRQRGYRIHVMTGVSWGHYQDYLYGRFDGTNHEDEAQTDRYGRRISHGGDVYYMSPGENFGKFLCVGVQRALDAGAEAIHLEEPEFWVRGGYSPGFQRAWRDHYREDWQPPHQSVDAQWRASQLKYLLYRRALQQVFDHIQDFNRRAGRQVRCYVPTHSLLNYAHWRIVSPESSLARLQGCDGYIAQVWTGTARTPNLYRGQLRERTFETAFLEYGAMQNLVRATGRTVWYLNDPIEDDPKHDWDDYRRNWESTLVASLLQPDVWRFEVAPWPERVFAGRYPAGAPDPQPMPPPYATEVQTVFNALNHLRQDRVAWDSGTRGIGLVISDSLMFQRGDPHPGDPHLSNVYGLALPFLKRGMPVTPVQLENVTLPGALDDLRILLLTYRGMKPLTPDVHAPIAQWVRKGGLLVLCDDDRDPYLAVREWWNTAPLQLATPRLHLFQQLDLSNTQSAALQRGDLIRVGRGAVRWLVENPSNLAALATGDLPLRHAVRDAATALGLPWTESNHLLLRRGPFLIAAGLDESIPAPPRSLPGRWISLFDPELRLRREITIEPGFRGFLLDLDLAHTLAPDPDPQPAGQANTSPRVLLSACKTLPIPALPSDPNLPAADPTTATSTAVLPPLRLMVEGVGNTPAIVLLHAPHPPQRITLDDQPLTTFEHAPADQLLRVRFPNEPRPRELRIEFAPAVR